jgi:hypothetical protein
MLEARWLQHFGNQMSRYRKTVSRSKLLRQLPTWRVVSIGPILTTGRALSFYLAAASRLHLSVVENELGGKASEVPSTRNSQHQNAKENAAMIDGVPLVFDQDHLTDHGNQMLIPSFTEPVRRFSPAPVL